MRLALVFLFGCLCCAAAHAAAGMPEAARARFEDLRLSAYVVVGEAREVAAEGEYRATMLRVLDGLGVSKVYVEVYRGGVTLTEDEMRAIRVWLESRGYAVAAGIATVPGGDFGVAADTGLHWFNFQARKTRDDLAAVTRATARVFDEYIVDDFLCSGDMSAESEAAKGPRSWGAYRRDLMIAVSEEVFIGPARAENPDITMIVKFPQWYDRFHLFGYDPERMPQIYDRVFVGTETRGANTQRFGFVQPYEGFINYRWLAALSGGKIGGAWFDHGDCDGDDFVDQAYQSVLAGASELVLFSYAQLREGHPGHPLLLDAYPHLADLARVVRRHPVIGTPVVKPPHSDPGGDMYLMDFLGMLGLPIVPAPALADPTGPIILPTQAAHDSHDAAKLVRARMAARRATVVTTGFLAKVDRDDVTALAGFDATPKSSPALAESVRLPDGSAFEVPHGLRLGDGAPRVGKAEVLLTALVDGREVPFLTAHTANGATLYVMNTHTFSQEDFDAVGEVLLAPRPLGLIRLPEPWLAVLRDVFAPGHPLKAAPARVTCQPLGEDGWFIQNYNDTSAHVALRIDDPVTLHDGFTGALLGQGPGRVAMEVPARGRWWVRAR